MTICWWLVLKVKRALFSACPTFNKKNIIFIRFFSEKRRNFALGLRKDAGVVDRDGLENRCTGNRTEGSNPSLSANKGVNQQIMRFTPFIIPKKFLGISTAPPFFYIPPEFCYLWGTERSVYESVG